MKAPKSFRPRFLRRVPWEDIGLALIAAAIFCSLLAFELTIVGI